MEFGINEKLNFCIMTTANYLTKALVMYDSLLKECKNGFTLFYFTFDEITYEYLQKLNYDNIIAVPLYELEKCYPELESTKSNRDLAEYFFTCTPHIIDYVLKQHNTNHVTYLDADLFFYQDPRILIDELQEKSVLITKHNYYPPVENHPSGKFCVQFIPIKNDLTGNKVVTWWKRKCIEWCYLREEDGKFGDQGYLNEWPKLFDNIVIMKNRGGGVAQWNYNAYKFYKENNKLKAFNSVINKDVDVIFYHFQALGIFSNKVMTFNVFRTDKNVFENIYIDYIEKLSKKEEELLGKLEISRKELDYKPYEQTDFRLLLSVIRRLLIPYKRDRILYYKYLNKYKWLP